MARNVDERSELDFRLVHYPSQAATSDALSNDLAVDNQVFDAIDRCNVKTEASFWVDEAEFYHDKNGLMVGGPASVYHQDMDPNNFTRATVRTGHGMRRKRPLRGCCTTVPERLEREH